MHRSHPAWVCGLKQCRLSDRHNAEGVTPCVGVWIETVNLLRNTGFTGVTPCVGVWIETVCMSMSRISSGSHTLRGCVD